MNKLFYIVILSSVFLYSSCKDKEDPFDPGYAYYPMEVGDYKVYQVNQVTYLPASSTSESFQIKEVVTEIFTINGETRFRLERFKRADGSLPWPADPDSVWSAAVSNSKVVKVENNIRYVRLVFPVENGKTWNGNTENSFGEDGYTLKDLEKPFTVPMQTFSNTATVIQSPNDSSTFLSKDYRSEVYAKDVGLIYKVREYIEYMQNPDGTVNKNYIVDEGVRYSERLLSYGKQ